MRKSEATNNTVRPHRVPVAGETGRDEVSGDGSLLFDAHVTGRSACGSCEVPSSDTSLGLIDLFSRLLAFCGGACRPDEQGWCCLL